MINKIITTILLLTITSIGYADTRELWEQKIMPINSTNFPSLFAVKLLSGQGKIEKDFNIHDYYEEIGIPKKMHNKLDMCRILKEQHVNIGPNWPKEPNEACSEILSLYQEKSNRFQMELILEQVEALARMMNKWACDQSG